MRKCALGFTLLHAFVAERAITIATRVLTDVPMLAILAWDSSITGLTTAFAVITPVYLFLCVSVVLFSDAAFRRGLDVTGLETLRRLEHEVLGEKQWFRKLVQKILRSRKLIFWIGSWFYLDPDYVTLLLRKREEGYISTFFRITLPSVVISMMVWLGVWWAAIQGVRWAIWLLEWVL
ncbi:MAG: hypothetical protein AABX72_02790 [Nanoarchaeota archaeon]